jgi:hypothetical protein
MGDFDTGAIVSIISGIVSALGALVAIYVVIYKIKPERAKIENESDAALAEASESLAAGTKTSIDYWRLQLVEQRDQINELKEKDRQRTEELRAMEARHAEELRLISENQIVTQRLIEEQRRELIAWQDWAKRLSHQVVSLGGQPVPFKIKSIEEYLDRDLDAHE